MADRNKFINIDLSEDGRQKSEKKELELTDLSKKSSPKASVTPKKSDKSELKEEFVSGRASVRDMSATVKKSGTADKPKGRDVIRPAAPVKDSRSTPNKPQRERTAEVRPKQAVRSKAAEEKAAKSKAANVEKQAAKSKAAADEKRTKKEQPAKNTQKKTAQAAKPVKKKDSRRIKRIVVFVLTLVLISLIVFAAYWFVRAQEIAVEGNVNISAEDIITVSGIRTGDHFFTIDKGKCEENIEKVPQLDFIGLDFELPGKLIIKVRERSEAAQYWLESGKYLIVDDEGVALSESEVSKELPIIEGLKVTQHTLAYAVRTDDSSKADKLSALIKELEAHYLIPDIGEIDLSDMGSVKLRTAEGIEVHFGDIASTSDICRKVTWIQSVLPVLNEQGYTSGILNVTSEEQATFEPPQGAEGEGSGKIVLSEVGEAVPAH